jgi:GAF domain-containing protein/HAMP domain-containing protein
MDAVKLQENKPTEIRIGPHASPIGRESITYLIGIVTLVAVGVFSFSTGIFTLFHPTWQSIAVTGFQLFAWIFSILAVIGQRHSTVYRVSMMIVAITIMMFGLSIFVDGLAIPATFIVLVYTIILTSVTVTGVQAERDLTLGVFGAWLVSLIGLIAPFEKFSLPGSDLFFPTVLGIFAMIYLTLLAMEYVTASLRLRLTFSGLILVLLPLLAVSLIQSLLVKGSVSERIQESLLSASNQTAFRVDDFLATNRDSIARDATIPIFAQYLSSSQPSGSDDVRDLQITFEALQKRPQQNIVSYGLLDVTGQVKYDLNQSEIGKLEASTEYFAEAVRGKSYISSIEFSEEDQKPYVYFSSPVLDANKIVLGILRAKYDANVFQSILKENINLVGQSTAPILLDDHLIRLGDLYQPQNQFKSIAPISATDTLWLRSIRRITPDDSLEIATNLIDLSNQLTYSPNERFITSDLNPNNAENSGTEFIAVTHLTNKPWIVLYTQSASILDQLSTDQQKTISLIASILAGLVAVLTTIFAQALTRPINRLTSTAQKITEGDLTVSAPVSNDEIGLLANSFNIMTARLRQFISELEDRVRTRTSELAERNESLTFRSRQLQTISEVARSIAAAQDLETLLNEVATLVSSRFGFYHVGIFLVDDNHEFAILRAANSEGGKRMLARQHKLRVGQVGIVGYTTGNALPRIATDVGSDAVFFNNPDLPLTRSEMALPLIAGGQVIGALDVQSTQADAFSEEDVELFLTLADQVSVAIMNSRSFEESQKALHDAQLIHQQYLHQEWSRETREKVHLTYEYTQRGVTARERVVNTEIETVFTTGQALIHNASMPGERDRAAMMGIPIVLRGETIGIIHLQDQSSAGREWATEEIETVQSVADQVAQALENARLFEQTVRRADRERKVLEITSKIRSTTDPKAMLQIAVEELQRALHASKTQVILNSDESTLPDHNTHPSGSNGNGFSKA